METTKFDNELLKKLYKAVDELPNEAVESASKELTRKGYDTTGYQYQFLVNVLNEIVGVNNWGYTYKTIKESEGQWGNGRSFNEITVDMEVTILDAKRSCVGGHKSELHSDAYKGAITNALKKTLGMFGIGKKAYEGTLDDDYRPIPETQEKTIIYEKPVASLGKKQCEDCGKEFIAKADYQKKCLDCWKKANPR